MTSVTASNGCTRHLARGCGNDLANQRRRNKDDTSDDFANCELSIEELEAIAAGWPYWLHTVGHIAADIGTGAGKFLLNAAGVPILAVTGAAVVGAILGGGGQSLTTNKSMN